MKMNLVSFYTEGNNNDKGSDLTEAKNIIINSAKDNVDNISFYTPKILRDMGYHYHVKEYNNLGLVYMNPKFNLIGFAAWKPLIILLELEKMKNGDILVYRDINVIKYPQLKNYINFKKNIINIMNRVNFDFFIPRENNTLCLEQFCKTNIINDLAINPEFTKKFPLLIVNLIIVRKSKISIKFIKEWLMYCEVEKYINGEQYGKLSPKFKWFCPEQCILGVIVSNWVYQRKYNIPLKYPNIICKDRYIDNLITPTNYKYLKLKNNNNNYLLIILLIILFIFKYKNK